jgi:molecular chaperone GrpE
MTEKDQDQENQQPQLEEAKSDLHQEVEDLKDKLLRSNAEMANLRKRFEKQLDETRDYAITGFAKDLVAVTDNIQRAMVHNAQESSPEVENIMQGLEMIFAEFKAIMAKNGICAIEAAVGDHFDYNIHQAISKVATNDYPKGVIIDIMQVGYKLKDRLLRPVVVVISDGTN